MTDKSSLVSYGTHADQYMEVWQPSRSTWGRVVLVHGGYWRQAFSCTLMHPLAQNLCAAGWQVFNIEYRRGAHGWAALWHDVGLALAGIRQNNPQVPLAWVGHSVGGQLALLAAATGERVVALAPVTNLVDSYRLGAGEQAVQEFFQAAPENLPEVYRKASPLAQVPPAAGEILIIHGIDDERVPVAHSRVYANAVKALHGSVTLWEYPHLLHRPLIDPMQVHWPAVCTWLKGDTTGFKQFA